MMLSFPCLSFVTLQLNNEHLGGDFIFEETNHIKGYVVCHYSELQFVVHGSEQRYRKYNKNFSFHQGSL